MKNLIILTIILFTVQFLAPSLAQNEQKPELIVQTGHASMVLSVAFSSDGKILASGSGDKTIKLWNVETGQQIKSLEGHADSVRSVAFSPDGKTLISGSDDKTIKLWNVETGQLIKSLEGHADFVTSLAFIPDGKTFISGSFDRTMRLWDKQSNKLLAILTSLDKDDWIIVTPEGRFDTNKLENPEGLHWIMPDAPFMPLSFEIFAGLL